MAQIGDASRGKSKWKSGLIGVAIAIGLSGLIILTVIWFVDADSRKRSATATAEVIEATAQSWQERRSTKSGHRVLYRFQAAGRTYEAADERNGWYKPGAAEPLRVCYDPADPTQSDLRSPRGADCGKGVLF